MINSEWLQNRISPEDRGIKADLARALGVKPYIVSRMLNGERRVQSAEIPAILEFFKGSESDNALTHEEKRILELWRLLPDEHRQALEIAARGLATQNQKK
ncbi:MAG: hypothetical protein ABJL33_15385 [Hyphomicrobiales bacterium]